MEAETASHDDSLAASSFRHDDEEEIILNIVQDRRFMAQHCIRGEGSCRYAIKMLSDKTKADKELLLSGVVDLAMETRFLAVCKHPNLVKMRAVAYGSPYDPDYFLILDKLYDTLHQRILKWKKRKIGGVFGAKKKKQMAFWIERVTVGYDLANGLKYMHKNKVIYRDIKPDNIGFDVRGDVKIFDLGLAREFKEAERADDGTYSFTGDTGSPRYMAPEVMLSQPYNETADVYSFSVLFWQILKMEKAPYEGFNVRMLRNVVATKGVRPVCEPDWPVELAEVIKLGWDKSIDKRPSMAIYAGIIQDEINSNSDEQVTELLDQSRKSEVYENIHESS